MTRGPAPACWRSLTVAALMGLGAGVTQACASAPTPQSEPASTASTAANVELPDDQVIRFVPEGAYATSEGLVMIVGVENLTSEPFLLQEEMLLEEVRWPDNVGIGYFISERDKFCSHGCPPWDMCSSGTYPIVAPGAKVYTLHEHAGQVSVDEGSLVEVTASMILAWPLCARPPRKVKKKLGLRVQPTLLQRFGGPGDQHSPLTGTARDTAVPEAMGAPEAFVAGYRLPAGTGVLIGVVNRTDMAARIIDNVVVGLQVGGRMMQEGGWQSDEHACGGSTKYAVEPGVTFWFFHQQPEGRNGVGAPVVVDMDARFGAPFCKEPFHAFRTRLRCFLEERSNLPPLRSPFLEPR